MTWSLRRLISWHLPSVAGVNYNLFPVRAAAVAGQRSVKDDCVWCPAGAVTSVSVAEHVEALQLNRGGTSQAPAPHVIKAKHHHVYCIPQKLTIGPIIWGTSATRIRAPNLRYVRSTHMETTTVPVEGIAIPVPEADPQAAITPDDTATETKLSEEIITLWSEHLRLNTDRRISAQEQRQVRAALAQRLFAAKAVLCRIGRGGQWRSWLKIRHIPRTTADRLCERYAETLGTENGNVPTGATYDNEATVEQLVQSLVPRLRRKLSNVRSVFRFIDLIAAAFGLVTEANEYGVTVYQPEAAEGEDSAPVLDSPEPASEGVPSPEPSDDVPAIAE